MAAIQPAILESLGRLELLPWISVGFAVGSAPILPWGKCFGIFSVKKLFLLQIVIFEIGSAVCGAAPNMTTMVIGRVIAGLGGSGMYSGALSYIAMLTTEVERSRYVAGVSAVWGLGSVLGPVVSTRSRSPHAIVFQTEDCPCAGVWTLTALDRWWLC